MIQDPIALLAFMFAIVAGARALEARVKAVEHISSAVLCTLLGIALANLGVIPHASPVHAGVTGLAVPYAIVLVILSTRLADLRTAGWPIVIAFGLATVGSTLGGLIAGGVFHPWIGPETWKVAGQFTGAFIGGGVNFVAIGRGLETSPSLFAAANVADNLSTVPWMLAQMGLVAILAPFFREAPAGSAAAAPAAPAGDGSIAQDIEDNPRLFWTEAPITTTQLAMVAALPLAALWGARQLAPLLPGFPEVLWLTTIALVLAQVPQMAALRRASAVGSYFALHLFFISIGAGSVIADVVKAGPSLLVFMTAIIAIHAIVVYGIGWLIGLDLRSLTIASQAAVGGPGSALALSLSLKWKSLVTPGILVGILGYAIGNYFGFACAYIVRGWQS